MLVVVGIIGLLTALLLSASVKARAKMMEVKTLTDVKRIELAWKKYYQEYQAWPNTLPCGIPDLNEQDALAIKGPVAALFQGDNDPSANNNPKQLQFMNFTSLDSNNNPVNPWGRKPVAQNNPKHYCYVKFDKKCNYAMNQSARSFPENQPPSSVRADVIVCTFNPNVPDTADNFVIVSCRK
jgi:type II secretory pathway pseudopilin PulG